MVSPGNIQDQAKEMGNQAKQYGRASQTLYERNKGLLWVVGAVAVMGYGYKMYKDSMKPNPSLMDRGKHKAEAAFEAAKRE